MQAGGGQSRMGGDYLCCLPIPNGLPWDPHRNCTSEKYAHPPGGGHCTHGVFRLPGPCARVYVPSAFLPDAPGLLPVLLRLGPRPALSAASLPLCHSEVIWQKVLSPRTPVTVAKVPAKLRPFGTRGCSALKPERSDYGSSCHRCRLRRLCVESTVGEEGQTRLAPPTFPGGGTRLTKLHGHCGMELVTKGLCAPGGCCENHDCEYRSMCIRKDFSTEVELKGAHSPLERVTRIHAAPQPSDGLPPRSAPPRLQPGRLERLCPQHMTGYVLREDTCFHNKSALLGPLVLPSTLRSRTP